MKRPIQPTEIEWMVDMIMVLGKVCIYDDIYNIGQRVREWEKTLKTNGGVKRVFKENI